MIDGPEQRRNARHVTLTSVAHSRLTFLVGAGGDFEKESPSGPRQPRGTPKTGQSWTPENRPV
jgi:hypothetical protein